MVYHRTTYYCGRCHSEHRDPEAARSCETDHIVQDAVNGFKSSLDEIFSTVKPKIKSKKKKKD